MDRCKCEFNLPWNNSGFTYRTTKNNDIYIYIYIYKIENWGSRIGWQGTINILNEDGDKTKL